MRCPGVKDLVWMWLLDVRVLEKEDEDEDWTTPEEWHEGEDEE